MITEPGVYDIPMRDYLADPCPEPSVSAGLCKTIIEKSPEHAALWHPRLGHRPKEHSLATDIGTVCHELLLNGSEGFEVSEEYDSYRTKAAKEWRDSVRAEGKVPVLEKDFETPSKMVWHAKQFLQEVLSDMPWQAEQSVFWQKHGFWHRARPDVLSVCRSVIVDYKTCQDASPRAFHRDARSLRYALSAAHYIEGVKEATGVEPRYIFMAQEKNYPYACSVHEFETLEQANIDRQGAIDHWRVYMDMRNAGVEHRPYSTWPYVIQETW